MRLIAVALLSCALASCDGSSGDDSPSTDDALLLALTGLVVDAVTGAPLGGVEVIPTDGGEPVLSDGDGRFRFGELPPSDAPDLRFVLDGYREELYARPSLGDGDDTIPRPSLGDGEVQLETVALVPDDNAGDGGLVGTLVDADGEVVPGALIRFLAGINVREGDAAASTTTAADGSWSVTGLGYGNYTCIILIDGEEPIYRTVRVLGGIDDEVGSVVAPFSVAPPASTPEATSPAEVTFPPESDADGEALESLGLGWRLDERVYAPDAGRYTVDRRDRLGTLGLNTTGNDVDGPNGAIADSSVSVTHTLRGEGRYRLTRDLNELDVVGRTGERVALVFVVAGGTTGLTGFDIYNELYYPVLGPEGRFIDVRVDEAGRYRFSASLPMEVVRLPGPNQDEPIREGVPRELVLTVDDLYVP